MTPTLQRHRYQLWLVEQAQEKSIENTVEEGVKLSVRCYHIYKEFLSRSRSFTYTASYLLCLLK